MLKKKTEEPAIRDWLEGYNLSIDGQEKKYYLDIGLSESRSPENLLRQELWEHRFTKKGRISGMDFFMAQWMELSYLQKNMSAFLKKRNIKSLEKIRKNLMFDAGTNDSLKVVLHQEYQNLVSVYIDLCNRDKGYDKLILGFKTISPERLIAKIASDVYDTGCGTPRMYGKEQDFKLLSDAARDAFFFAYPSETQIWENAIDKFEKTYL